ncbi:MAG: hypothetical protein M1820_003341 [Bogoriella megaspora]|nr:MAG: hypothetical protein M1820_003341 [Bogoriella megaspora]
MSSAAHVVATLPSPFDRTSGRSQASGVQSFTLSRRKKRAEVVTAIDGEGLSIYSVCWQSSPSKIQLSKQQLRNPHLLASYNTPPHSRFLTPPCSVYWRRHAQQPARRFTYTSTQDSDGLEGAHVVAFFEEIQKEGNTSESKVQKYSYKPSSSSQILSLEILPKLGIQQDRDQSPTHSVILLYQDGSLESRSADLQEENWKAILEPLESPHDASFHTSSFHIDLAVLTNAEIACKGILKDRPDITSTFSEHIRGNPEALANIPLLFVLSYPAPYTSTSQRTLRIFTLEPYNSHLTESGHSSRNTLPSLGSWTLPESNQKLEHEPAPKFRLCPSSAHLFEATDALRTYDLTGLLPNIVSNIPLRHQPRDVMPLATNLVMVAFDNSYAIYDIKFLSVQATYSNPPKADALANTEEHSGPDSREHYPVLIYQLSELRTAVALRRNTLLGLQLDPVLRSRKRKRGSSTRLIDSIQRGIGRGLDESLQTQISSKTAQHPLMALHATHPSLTSQLWKSDIPKLDAFARSVDTQGFEKLFFRHIATEYYDEAHNAQSKSAHGQKQMVRSHYQKDIVSQYPVAPPAISYLDKEKVDYALSRIFTLVQNNDHIDANGDSLNTRASLTISFMPPAVFKYLTSTGKVTFPAIAQAIARHSNWEQGFEGFGPADVVNAIHRFDSSGRFLSMFLEQPATLDIVEVLQALIILIQAEKSKVNSEGALIDYDAQGTEADQVQSKMLSQTLFRLHAFPATEITQAIRSTLSPGETSDLVTMLRRQLFVSGWLSDYAGSRSSPSLSANCPDISITADLLNCAVDAMGISGWLLAQDDQDTNDEVLSNLRNEASAVLESIHEMQSLRDIFMEFSKHGALVYRPKSQKPPMQDTNWPSTDTALPMGKQDNKISKVKIDATGQVKERSKRDIYRELSKRVGEYSLERIRF